LALAHKLMRGDLCRGRLLIYGIFAKVVYIENTTFQSG
jgi:hypothetical protein